jgi:hypothetical protein
MAHFKEVPSLQIKALLRIVTVFKVEKGSTMGPGLVIRPGLTRPNSKWVIRYESEFHNFVGNIVRPYSLDTTVSLAMDGLRYKQTGGETASLADCIATETNSSEGPGIQVLNVPMPIPGQSKLIKCKATVHLEYLGDGLNALPEDKTAWPSVTIL